MRKSLQPLFGLVLAIILLGPGASINTAQGQEKVVVLDFLTLDTQGEYIEPTQSLPDIINLSRVMAQGIASRLVQYGEYETIN